MCLHEAHVLFFEFQLLVSSRRQAHLTENGVLVVEIGGLRADVEKAFPTLPFVWLSTAQTGDEVCLSFPRLHSRGIGSISLVALTGVLAAQARL